jgi:hypothetical protein
MIRHYAEPEGRVIFDHRHNADERTLVVSDQVVPAKRLMFDRPDL